MIFSAPPYRCHIGTGLGSNPENYKIWIWWIHVHSRKSIQIKIWWFSEPGTLPDMISKNHVGIRCTNQNQSFHFEWFVQWTFCFSCFWRISQQPLPQTLSQMLVWIPIAMVVLAWSKCYFDPNCDIQPAAQDSRKSQHNICWGFPKKECIYEIPYAMDLNLLQTKKDHLAMIFSAPPPGLEPGTLWLTVRCSNQLS